MEPGFLNTLHTQLSASGPKPSLEEKPTFEESPSPPVHSHGGGHGAPAAEDAMDVDMAAAGDVPNGEERVVAVRTTRSTTEQTKPPSLGEDHATVTEPPPKDQDPTDHEIKQTEKAIEGNDDAMCTLTGGNVVSTLPPRPRPWRPGWGRNPAEDILHTVPRSHGGSHLKRAVFRLWPRDPNGKPLMPSKEPRGTLSPDGYPWGATLYDFYHVNRLPDVNIATSIMTGSALWEAMKEMGELDVARPEIEWAKSEGEPRIEEVASTERLIEGVERRLQLRAYYKYSMLEDVRRMAFDKKDEVERAPGDEKGKDQREEKVSDHGLEREGKSEVVVDDVNVQPPIIIPPPAIPVTSPFHPSHYPKPWPFIPFENPLSVLLQERIPLHLLPQTLYVHDPFCILTALRRYYYRDTSWLSQPDFVQTYNLDLSRSAGAERRETRRKAQELEEFKDRTLIVLRYKRTREQIENHEPAIEVPLPPHPRRMTEVEESHLYLSPAAKVGDGHHSIVYRGEWELPRDLFSRPKICRHCFKKAIDEEIEGLKGNGRWEKLLRAAAWGPVGFTGRQPTQAELDEVNDPIDLERGGEIIEREIIEREIICIVPPNASPSHILEMIEGGKVWDVLMKQKDANVLHLDFTEGEDADEEGSYVATIRINPAVSYEKGTCAHSPRRFAVPRTARFTVVAKLSLQHDYHLAREANIYPLFPEHFFHHYNGYALLSQMHAIVPVNAIVPQFYGYYTPLKKGSRKDGTPRTYISPILLLEHCGVPIDPETLSIEDQEECASLLLRFQRAEWLHESVAPRNFLVQRGKPTKFPIERERHSDLSFRLIDFGRSRPSSDVEEKTDEEKSALAMFRKLKGKMCLTQT